MRIQTIKIKNFRNFADAEIDFGKDSVIVGSNDVGKTNLLYAIRLLLDKDLPEANLTPSITDFNIVSGSSKYEIVIMLCDITEECVHERMKGFVSEEGEMFLKLIGVMDRKTGKRDYAVYIGDTESNFQERSRYYLKTMHVKYIESARDLDKYIRREKSWLLENASSNRSEKEVEHDEKATAEIDTCLACITEKISSLNYVKKSTEDINKNIRELSSLNNNKTIVFKTHDTDSRLLLERLSLGTVEQNCLLPLGGDGFSNQAHLSLWALRQAHDALETARDTAVIYCIEEVESHLHPHQQRRLAKFMHEYFDKNQVIITTHSPQIAASFPPSQIVRIAKEMDGSTAYTEITGKFEERDRINFGYRLNAISAEIYFSDIVIFVEGPSEVLFYKAAAHANGVNLDRINASIVDVSGVGFAAYVDMALTFGTRHIVRTDNDVFKIPKKDMFRFAGVQRSVDIVDTFYKEDFKIRNALDIESLVWRGGRSAPPKASVDAAKKLKKILEKYDIFIADVDLEHDIVLNSPFSDAVLDYFNVSEFSDAIAALQDRKAENMFSMLAQKHHELSCLKHHHILAPIRRAVEMAGDKWE